MAQIDNYFKWCLKDPTRLKRVKPDSELAHKHLEKSEYNAETMRILEKSKRYDWALNIGFYAIYHCFLAILAKQGYESRNQRCSVTAIIKLIDNKKLEMDKGMVLQFDTLDSDKEITHATIRRSREASTYGVKSEVDTKQLEEVKDLIVKVQRETIKVLNQ